MRKPGENPIMTPSQLEALESDLRERAKPLGDRHWIDGTQRLASDLADVVAHLRGTEQDAEQGFHDAQQAANAEPVEPVDMPAVEVTQDPLGQCVVRIGGRSVWTMGNYIDAVTLQGSIHKALTALWPRPNAGQGTKCLDCRQTIVGAMVGAGDGTGNKYRCRECALRADITNRDAAIEQLTKTSDMQHTALGAAAVIVEARDTEIERLQEELRDQALTIEDAVARLGRITEEREAAVTEEREACALVCGTMADFAANMVVTSEIGHAKQNSGIQALQDAVDRIRTRGTRKKA